MRGSKNKHVKNDTSTKRTEVKKRPVGVERCVELDVKACMNPAMISMTIAIFNEKVRPHVSEMKPKVTPETAYPIS